MFVFTAAQLGDPEELFDRKEEGYVNGERRYDLGAISHVTRQPYPRIAFIDVDA